MRGLTGSQTAELAKVTQPTISKIECGYMVASPDVLDRILVALSATRTQKHELHQMLDAVAESVRLVRGTPAPLADHLTIVTREQAAHTIRCFQPVIVPPMLHTTNYARHITAHIPWLTNHSAEVIALTVERQSLLYRFDRGNFEFVLTDTALCPHGCPPELVAEQHDRLLSLATIPYISIRLLPADAEHRPLPWCAFTIYDDASVATTTFTGEALTTDPHDITTYTDAFAKLSAAARDLTGGETP
jgi:hypothetical protein